MITAQEALNRLQEGNRRFVAGNHHSDNVDIISHREELVHGQQPFATIVGCSDSRAPVECIFDQGPGDLFVVRVAGNVLTSTQIGSVEFAVEKLGCPLVVVMGHTRCGAIQATLAALRQPPQTLSVHLQSLVEYLRPSVEAVLEDSETRSEEDLVALGVRANVRHSVHLLEEQSEIVRRHIQQGDASVIGAEYALETGKVEFL
jgi:carbonic anhydrase